MPKVSVLMTNYNGGEFIGEAIESILGQTFTDFELIIVDDGSMDRSWEIIQKYQTEDARVRGYKNNKNLGISRTRNRLIDLARGDYFAWLDSDDRAKPQRLEKQIYFLDTHAEYGIVGSWMMLIDTHGHEKGIKQLPVTDGEIRQQWYMRNSLNHPTLMMRKECIKKTGYYDSEMDGAEDYDFGVRAGVHFLLANMPEVLTEYRIHGSNASLKKHKKTIQKTLLVRKKMRLLGYHMGVVAYMSYFLTWAMQFISPRIVVPLFYFFIKLFSIKNPSRGNESVFFDL